MGNNILQRHNVQSFGNGTETLVFAHGFGTDQTAWQKVADAFRNTYKIVLFDNIGSGRTDFVHYNSHKYSHLQAYADDLLAVLETLDIEKATLVSHSVSGMIGTLAAVKAPSKFTKIAMVGASPRYLNDGDYVGGFRQEDLDNILEAMETNYYSWVSGFSQAAMTYPDRPELAQQFASTLNDIRPDIAQSVSRTIFQSDVRQSVPQLQAETLIIQAREDIAVPLQVAEYLHKNIPQSTLKVIDATGHFPHISEPKQVIEALQTFI